MKKAFFLLAGLLLYLSRESALKSLLLHIRMGTVISPTADEAGGALDEEPRTFPWLRYLFLGAVTAAKEKKKLRWVCAVRAAAVPSATLDAPLSPSFSARFGGRARNDEGWRRESSKRRRRRTELDGKKRGGEAAGGIEGGGRRRRLSCEYPTPLPLYFLERGGGGSGGALLLFALSSSPLRNVCAVRPAKQKGPISSRTHVCPTPLAKSTVCQCMQQVSCCRDCRRRLLGIRAW